MMEPDPEIPDLKMFLRARNAVLMPNEQSGFGDFGDFGVLMELPRPEHGIPDFISFMRARNPVF